MSDHAQFADNLALYALGVLDGKDRVELDAHLENCPACRRELDALRSDVAMLALSASEAAPRPQARDRFLAAMAKEPRRSGAEPARAPRRWAIVPSLAVAALALVTLAVAMQNGAMRKQISGLERTNSQLAAGLEQAHNVIDTLNDATSARFTLSATQSPAQPHASAIYSRDRRSLVFIASNMAPLQPQKVYELWLIPVSGAPIPSGLFTPDAQGGAIVINPPLPAGVQAKTFAVTVEPQAGSAAPTSQPIMVGTGG